MAINRVILVGHLSRDPEMIATTGKPMTTMRIATRSQWKDADGDAQDSAEFHSVVCFGRLAEICAVYCSNRSRVYVEGQLRTSEHAGPDGFRRFTTEIVAGQAVAAPRGHRRSGRAGHGAGGAVVSARLPDGAGPCGSGDMPDGEVTSAFYGQPAYRYYRYIRRTDELPTIARAKRRA